MSTKNKSRYTSEENDSVLCPHRVNLVKRSCTKCDHIGTDHAMMAHEFSAEDRALIDEFHKMLDNQERE